MGRRISPSGCVNCTTGKYQQKVEGSYEICEAGRYSNTMKATQYFSCPRGQFQSVTVSTDCNLCALGQYQSSEGAGNCTKRASGRFSAVKGARGSLCVMPAGSMHTKMRKNNRDALAAVRTTSKQLSVITRHVICVPPANFRMQSVQMLALSARKVVSKAAMGKPSADSVRQGDCKAPGEASKTVCHVT